MHSDSSLLTQCLSYVSFLIVPLSMAFIVFFSILSIDHPFAISIPRCGEGLFDETSLKNTLMFPLSLSDFSIMLTIGKPKLLLLLSVDVVLFVVIFYSGSSRDATVYSAKSVSP